MHIWYHLINQPFSIYTPACLCTICLRFVALYFPLIHSVTVLFGTFTMICILPVTLVSLSLWFCKLILTSKGHFKLSFSIVFFSLFNDCKSFSPWPRSRHCKLFSSIHEHYAQQNAVFWNPSFSVLCLQSPEGRSVLLTNFFSFPLVFFFNCKSTLSFWRCTLHLTNCTTRFSTLLSS